MHIDRERQVVTDELGDPPTPDRAARLAQRLLLVIHLLGAEPWSSAGSPPEFPSRSSVARTLADGTEVTLARGQDGFVVRAQRGDVGVVLLPQDPRRADKAPLAVGLTIAGVLLVLMLAHHRIRRLFRPIETLRAGIARIGGGDLRHRLVVSRRDELGELADGINAMADDISEMLKVKRQLLLAVSHELRSPLTRARVQDEFIGR